QHYRYGVVSSVSAGGVPQSAIVGIAIMPELEIIFDTLSSTRKYANLTRNPACSLVIGEGEQTVQLEGTAFELHDQERSRYFEAYFAAWPECRAHLEWPGITHFVVRPTWIRYSDFDQRPPLIEEVEGLP
ncbi:MAG TPA: pyridoxamine 5'-phosphate oxidase family protein, partial [Acidobacteriaceae bacterium]